MDGIIIRGIGGFYYVKTNEGIFECKARGIFRKEKLTPIIGDKCQIDVLDKDNMKGNVVCILPRKNQLVRPSVANIGVLCIVCSACSPEPDTIFIDKLTVIAESNNIKPILIINKIDLPNGADNVMRLKTIYEKVGYTVITASADSNIGIEKIKYYLEGNIAAFSGASGVGKSSLLNLIMPKAEMETGDVSLKTQRGKHTTRHVEMLYGDKLMIMDTPGFSMLEFSGISAPSLEVLFVEFEPYIGSCRFRGCMHVNEPNCAIKQAVENNDIKKSRYDSYVEFYNALKNIKEWES